MIILFHKWKEAKQISKMVQLVTFQRGGYDYQKDIQLLQKHEKTDVRISENGIIVIPQGMKLGFE